MTSRRALVAASVALAVVLLVAPPVGAHGQIDPAEVGPGTIVDFTLTAQNERQDMAVVKVEVQVPGGIPVVSADNAGWGLEQGDGAITWTRSDGPAGESPELRFRLGPLPAEEGQVQLKTIFTYTDGSEDAWIQDWPAGSPEPERPGPVIRLVAGAPGTLPEQVPTTTTTTEATTTTTTEATSSTTSTPSSSSTTEPAVVDEADDGDSPLPWVMAVVVVGAAGAAGVYALSRRAQGGSGTT